MLSLLWGLLWIVDDKNLYVWAISSVPTPSPWFRGGSPTPLVNITEPKKHKKVRKVKRRKRSSQSDTGAGDGGSIQEESGEEENNKHESTLMEENNKHESTLVESEQSVSSTPGEVKGESRLSKRRRRVKVKHHSDVKNTEKATTEDNVVMSCPEEQSAESSEEVTTLSDADSDHKHGVHKKKRKAKVKRRRVHPNAPTEDSLETVQLPARILPQVADVPTETRLETDHVQVADQICAIPAGHVHEEKATTDTKIEIEDAALDRDVMEQTQTEDVETVAGQEEDETVASIKESNGELSKSDDESLDENVIVIDEADYGKVELQSVEGASTSFTADDTDSAATYDSTTTVKDLSTSIDDLEAKVVEDKQDVEIEFSLAHDTFEREVVKVEDDYIPNLGEFDSTASEETTVEEETLAQIESETSVLRSGKGNAMPSVGASPDNINRADNTTKIDSPGDLEGENVSPAITTGAESSDDSKMNISATNSEADEITASTSLDDSITVVENDNESEQNSPSDRERP